MKRFRIFLTWVLLVLAAGAELAAAAPNIRTVWAYGRAYSNLYDMTRQFGLQLRVGKGRYDVTGNGSRMVLYPDKRYMFLNGVRVNQCFSPVMKGGATYVSRTDYTKTFTPLLGSKRAYKHPVGTIFLDCGHGGKDQGAAGKFSQEKNITLRLGRRLAAILRSCGYKVVMSRNSDVFLSLERRTALQASTRSDLFISLHVNSAGDRSVSGIETYCMTPAGAPSSNSTKADARTYNGNRYDSNNIILAWNLQRSMLSRTKAADRGVKRARFQVLRDIRCPGALVEIGFISNAAEERNLGSAAYIEKLARGLAEGILNYHRSLSK
ncbi:N-acetylmuramoyl-L-alanine amidase [uncultured Victivallis sp.]|uniref:N-acetylmuramoyl-L-alanine amidase family protein n=1 Tax=uncultured Victivallis sp. TaxID=354118 RepID=UPI00258D9284|nr:N-acetylmuramoyl-L-alanine amidase [uncultured Victivallis sp.]